MPTFGSLFAGIGGIDLGLESAGWTCKWQVEIEPFCQEVLKKHWPKVPKFGDVRKLSGKELCPVDLIAGGFPCQPSSCAGRRMGKEDPRWLWPQFARIISVLRPPLVLVENVPGLFKRGFGEVLGGLAACGYDAEWDCLPAAAFGAPHLRYRVFIVAHANGRIVRNESGRRDGASRKTAPLLGDDSETQPVAYANIERFSRNDKQTAQLLEKKGQESAPDADKRRLETTEQNLLQRKLDATRSTVGNAPYAYKPRLEGHGVFGECPRKFAAWSRLEKESIAQVAADLCGVDDGIPARVDRLKALGNAVVPQVSEWLGLRIIEVFGLGHGEQGEAQRDNVQDP